jgi:hypothetical protein
MKRIFLFPALALILAACSNPSGGDPTPSSPNSITGLTVNGTAGVINAGTRTVTVTVSPLTALTGLAPVITIDGTSVSPASEAAQDFFTTGGFLPVVYTVTGADGSKAIWTVTVKWAPLDPGDIAVYLGSSPPAGADGGVPGGPVILPASVDLSGGGWAALLTTISGSASPVALDLSACPGMAEFDPDYTNSTGKGKIVSLILPDAATSIKAGTDSNPTFKDFSALKSVTGGAVTTVGDYAFWDCDDLETVSLPAATTIGNHAFLSCGTLEMVSLPAATNIGGNAFLYCTGLKTVNLPTATSIGSFVLFDCTALETVNLPAATNIGNSAFSGCIGLTSISLPAVISIDNDVFGSCTGLSTISLPASLTTINGNPFTGCPNLTITVAAANLKYKVEDGNKLLSKDDKTLVGWPGASGSVTLNGITTVGGFAFSGCTGLTTVSLPAATSIGEYAFYYCTGLASVSLPAATSIGSYAFSDCTALETVSLPAATSISGGAFAWTGTTTSLTITLGPAVPTLGTGMFSNVTGGTKTVTVTVPNGAGAWSGKTDTFTTDENTTGGPHWGEGFRGKGWTSGSAYGSGTVNENISLTVEEETL